jgi:hypothetical protein
MGGSFEVLTFERNRERGYYPEDVDVLRYLRLVWTYHGTGLLIGVALMCVECVKFHPAPVPEGVCFADCQGPMGRPV